MRGGSRCPKTWSVECKFLVMSSWWEKEPRRKKTTGKDKKRSGYRAWTRLLAICWGVCWACKCCHLRRQATDDWRFFVFMCTVSGVPSLRSTHTFTPLQPTAHLASMEYPLNISLCSLSTIHSSRFDFFLVCVFTYKSMNSQPAAVAVTCACRDVIQLLSFSKSSPKHFCYDTHKLRTSMWPR